MNRYHVIIFLRIIFYKIMTVTQYIESVNSKADPNKNPVVKEMFFKNERK